MAWGVFSPVIILGRYGKMWLGILKYNLGENNQESHLKKKKKTWKLWCPASHLKLQHLFSEQVNWGKLRRQYISRSTAHIGRKIWDESPKVPFSCLILLYSKYCNLLPRRRLVYRTECFNFTAGKSNVERT